TPSPMPSHCASINFIPFHKPLLGAGVATAFYFYPYEVHNGTIGIHKFQLLRAELERTFRAESLTQHKPIQCTGIESPTYPQAECLQQSGYSFRVMNFGEYKTAVSECRVF
ncbi:MAG: hypothetical protein LAT80_15470, partial [Balneolaceae bacterium]|nr:hypothetical protein [Balneolaceae bacterium]